MPRRAPSEDSQGALITIDKIGKRFGEVRALNEVSLAINAGTVLAVCGENGAGKSTLMKILMGVYPPDEGRILLDRHPVAIGSPRAAQDLGIALVTQELSLAPDLSVEDNILLGLKSVPLFHRRAALRARAAQAAALLGWPEAMLDRKVGSLSLAERQLVEIARNLCRNARLLILDEPTASLPQADIERLFAAVRSLAESGVAVLYITHRLDEVFALSDAVAVMRNGELICVVPTGEIDRSKLVELMLGTMIESIYPSGTLPMPGSTPLLSVRALTVPNAVHGVDFDLHAGRVTGLAGQIGSGAEEVGRALFGLIAGASGEIVLHGQPLRIGSPEAMSRMGFAFVSDERARDGIFLDHSVSDNLTVRNLRALSRFGIIFRGALRTMARGAAEQVGIDLKRLSHHARDLSGGNQQKIAFARCLDAYAHVPAGGGVLILNEPTRGVDVGARAEIYRIVRDFCGAGYAVLMQSTDMEELLGLSHDILSMDRGRIVGRHRRPDLDAQTILAEITHAGAAGQRLAS
jgi:ABC-type sugar transport system ATPase subunit